MNLGTLTATLKLNARGFTGPVRGAQGELAKTERAAAGAGAGLASLAKRLLAAGVAYKAVATAARQLGDAVRTTAALESVLTRVGAVAGANADEMRRASEAAREMGRTTVYTARESAEAMQFMAMAGQDVSTIIGGLPAVLQLATAGAVGLGEAADVVTNIMAGFGKGASELGRVNDILVATFTGANVSLSELGESFKVAGPVAKTLGGNIEDVSAAIGVLGNAGIKGSDAGTGLKRAMTALLNPSKDGAAAMESLGLSASDASRGFVHMTRVLEKARSTMGAEEFSGKLFEVFGERAGPKMAALVEQGSVAIEKLADRIAGSDGLASRIEKAQLDTLSGQFDLVKSAADGLSEAMGARLAPATREAAEALAKLLNVATDNITKLSTFEQMVVSAREQSARWAAVNEAFSSGLADIGAEINRARVAQVEFGASTEDIFAAQYKLSVVIPDVLKKFAALRERAREAKRSGLDVLDGGVESIVASIDEMIATIRNTGPIEDVTGVVAEGAEAWASYSENVAASTRDLRVLLGEVKQISAGEFDAMLRARGGVTEVSRREFFGVAAASPFGGGSARGLPRAGSASTPSDALVGLGGGGSLAGDAREFASAATSSLSSAAGWVGGKIGKGIGTSLGGAGAAVIGQAIGTAIGSAFVNFVTVGLSTIVEALAGAASKLYEVSRDAASKVYAGLVAPTVGRAIPGDVLGRAGSTAAGIGTLGALGLAGVAAAGPTSPLSPSGLVGGSVVGAAGGPFVALAAAAGGATAGLLALGAESEKARQFYEVLDIAKAVLAEAAGGIFQSMMPLAGAFLEGANAIGPFIAVIADVSGLMPFLIDAFATTGGVVADLGYAGAVTARALADWARQVAERAGQDDIAANLLAFRDNMTEAALAARDAGVAFDNITTGSAAQAAYTALLEAKAAETEATVAVTESLRQMHEQLINVAPGFNTRNAVYRADQGLPPLSPISFTMVQGQLSGSLGPVG